MQINTSLLQKFANTTLSNNNTKKLLGDCIRKSFDEASSSETSVELLALAWKFQVPQFDEMLSDHSNHDYHE